MLFILLFFVLIRKIEWLLVVRLVLYVCLVFYNERVNVIKFVVIYVRELLLGFDFMMIQLYLFIDVVVIIEVVVKIGIKYLDVSMIVFGGGDYNDIGFFLGFVVYYLLYFEGWGCYLQEIVNRIF